MAKLTYYTSFQDLKTDKVHKNRNQSDSAKESEFKELVAFLSDHRHNKSRQASHPSSKQSGNGK
ncbi:hypothetical protein EDB95_3162 [Dinghuibacter silviterrae]|uniref:Uncharacterized protein n=1 Tax=Dinghuibacter silviterrae TaxID=1539049 RepID=A0A4R8DUP4_9BACT|nr:hypothetical protein EDB95_3162 [Dinghuibacter silviterrae]